MNVYNAVDAMQCCVWFAVPLRSYNFVTCRDHPAWLKIVLRAVPLQKSRIFTYIFIANFLAHV